jgi:hypothetical protein
MFQTEPRERGTPNLASELLLARLNQGGKLPP